MNFKGLEMQKWNMPTYTAQRVDEQWGHFSSYHVYCQNYGHQNVKNGSLVVFAADDSKQ